MEALPGNGINTEVMEHADGSGALYHIERFERVIAATGVDAGKKYKLGCEACPKHGRNLSCPPHSPTYEEYAGGYGALRVICLRVALEQFPEVVGEDRYRTAFMMLKGILEADLVKYRAEGNTVAGAGACLQCEQCSAEAGDTECVNPDLRIYSLESLGVNVVALSEGAFDLGLQWSGEGFSADYVTATGAVFYE